MESTTVSEAMILQVVEDPCQDSIKIEIASGEYKSADNNTSTGESGLSKRQLKKIRKKEKWLERKGEKRLRERTKAKEKRAHARANNIDLGPSRKALKRCTMADSSCKVTITIDMSFDELMQDKDIAKLIKQILRCYTLNRRAASPAQFSLTGFQGKSKQEMQKHNGYEHWDVQFNPEPYLSVYKDKKIIYLTSESENVIDSLEADCVYVIGGLVDHNSHKAAVKLTGPVKNTERGSVTLRFIPDTPQGHCHKLAMKEGIRHGRLPLDKFLKMKARKVLTVDHVFEILLRVIEGKTWQEAFMQVLPERKNAQPVLLNKTSCSGESELCDSSLAEDDNHDAAKMTVKNIDEGG